MPKQPIQHIFVINLAKSTDRMKHYRKTPPTKLGGGKIPYTRYPAVDGSTLTEKECSRMISMWSISRSHQQGKMGNFLSHLNLHKDIVKNRLNGVLILEDDADLRNVEIPQSIATLDGICFLGGWATSLKVKDKHLPLRFHPRNKYGGNQPTLNRIKRDHYRILQTRAYYIPNYKISQELINFIEGHKRVRTFDLMMAKFPKTEYFLFPAVATNRLGSQSTRDRRAKNIDHLLYYIEEDQTII